MSKGKGSKFQEVHVPEVHEFVNSVGNKFLVQGLPPLMLAEISTSMTRPKKPTYEVVTASGEVEIHEHDKESLTTPEDRAAWYKYIQEVNEADAEISNRMLACILIEGVIVADDVDLSRWEKRRKLMGLPVPEDVEEKILEYKRTEVIRSKEDIDALMNTVMGLTGVTEEEIEKAKSSFPDKMES